MPYLEVLVKVTSSFKEWWKIFLEQFV